MRLSAHAAPPDVPVRGRDLVAGAVRVIDEHRVLSALGHVAVVDLVADGAGLVELGIEVLFQALVVDVVAGIPLPPSS